MIQNVIIIKDGLPLLYKNCTNSDFNSDDNNNNCLFSNYNNLVMLSGFFSALNSFSANYKELGVIKELKLSNTDMKLSFMRNPSIPNLIFLATYNKNSDNFYIQEFLQKISAEFLSNYDREELMNWTGRVDEFEEFEGIIDHYLDGYSSPEMKNTTISLSQNNIVEDSDILGLIPKLNCSNGVNPDYYLTGLISKRIFSKIDGRKTIENIAKNLNISNDIAYNVIKSLNKMGFISF